METTVKQIAGTGKILTNGAGGYAYEVYLPIGIQWVEVDDEGQLSDNIEETN